MIMKKSKSKKSKKKDPLDGKVLCPKVGHEAQFAKAFDEMVSVAKGSLGWDGMSDVFASIGAFGDDPKEIKKLLQDVYLSNLYDHGDWVLPEEAEKRRQTYEVLYGKNAPEKVKKAEEKQEVKPTSS
jgi:hypothetical protein